MSYTARMSLKEGAPGNRPKRSELLCSRDNSLFQLTNVLLKTIFHVLLALVQSSMQE